MKRFKVNLDSGNSMWEVEARNLHDILQLTGNPNLKQPNQVKKLFRPPDERR